MAKIKLAKDFKDFLKLCLDHEVRFMVIGGYAVVHHSRPRYTGDLDIWVECSQKNAERVVAVLGAFGFRGEDISATLITKPGQIIRMGWEPMRLEIFTRIPGVDFEECYERRVLVKIGRQEVPFISLDDLIANKRASGRTKDLLDIEELS